MTASLTAAAAALAIGLPIFALGERIRGRRLSNQHIPFTRKDLP